MIRSIYRILASNPVFAVHPEIGRQLMTLALEMIAGEREMEAAAFVPAALEDSGAQVHEARNAAGRPAGRVLSYPIRGALFAEDQYCGPKGYTGMAQDMREIRTMANIDAVMLDIQSPGGQVTGLETLADAIAELREEKAVIAFVDGMAASAAYRLAIEADEIVLGGHTAEVGSIGVMLSYMDLTEFWRQRGVRAVRIVSSLSPEKNAFKFEGDQSDEDILQIQAKMLDPLAREFQRSVQAQRSDAAPESLRGAMYMGRDALNMGLADRIGTYTEAISRAAALAQKRRSAAQASSPRASHEDPNLNMNLLSRKLTAAEREDFAARLAARDAVHAEAVEQIEAAHAAEAARLRTEAAEAAARAEAAEQALAAAQAQADELRTALEAAQTRIAQLSAAPVNRVADQQGREAAPVADVATLLSAEQPIWAGFGQEDLEAARKNLGL